MRVTPPTCPILLSPDMRSLQSRPVGKSTEHPKCVYGRRGGRLSDGGEKIARRRRKVGGVRAGWERADRRMAAWTCFKKPSPRRELGRAPGRDRVCKDV